MMAIPRCNQRGLGLIEMLAIIIVIGIMVSMAMQSMTAVVQDARRTKTEREMDDLAQAIVGRSELSSDGSRSDFGYFGDIGAFPPDLNALRNNPGFGTWDGPYLQPAIVEDATGFKTDEWGQLYNFAGLILTSTGGPSTLTKKIASSGSDYLYNNFSGVVTDAADSIPGIVYADSVDLEIIVPNGLGGLATRSLRPDAAGLFNFDSLPAGIHPFRVIYQPTVDTVFRFVTILPRNKTNELVKLGANYFSGGGPTPQSEIIRPDGVGLIAALTPSSCVFNWECVDEAIADEASTYVIGSGNNWTSDSYSMQNPAASSGIIDSVLVFMRCTGPGGGLKARTLLRTGGTNFTGAQENLVAVTVFTDFSTTYANNPATGLAWTWAEITGLEIGVDIFKSASCTQVWADIHYTN